MKFTDDFEKRLQMELANANSVVSQVAAFVEDRVSNSVAPMATRGDTDFEKGEYSAWKELNQLLTRRRLDDTETPTAPTEG